MARRYGRTSDAGRSRSRAPIATVRLMSRATIADLIDGANGLDALIRTDTDRPDVPGWTRTRDFLEREIRGATVRARVRTSDVLILVTP